MLEIRNYQDEQAETRFQTRESARIDKWDLIKNKGVLDVESHERITIRKNLINPNDGCALERVVGNNDLMPINYLEVGLKAAKSVCRIQIRDERGRILGHGTGFLISPKLLLTNNHVIEKIENCYRNLIDFNFEDTAEFIHKEVKTFPLDPRQFFYTNKELDFTLVAVRNSSTDGTSLNGFGYLRLQEESGKALLGECVSIIQHPDGGTKQITLRENQIIDLFDNFIHYQTDTQPGSSGSPVFNDQWDVVALHHAGVRDKDNQGNIMSIGNTKWEPHMGEDKIKWIANEGIRISSICKHLREIRWNAEQNILVNELLADTVSSESINEVKTLETIERNLEWYANSNGYDPNFLGVLIPLPTLENIPEEIKSDELKYTHFSIVMNKNRRLAFFTAVNIDGEKSFTLRRGGDAWYFDPRIDKKYQSGPELYDRNDLDRGHLIRRLDPVWGESAEEANEDTFHFTNCSPQHKKLNQITWLQLEDYILQNAKKYNFKVCVFTGPVFRNDDMLYRGKFQIPVEFWKIAVMIKDNTEISATAYLQTQKNLIEDLEFAYGQYKTYQVPITKIEALTGLNFGELRNNDPLAGIEGAIGYIIENPNDIRC